MVRLGDAIMLTFAERRYAEGIATTIAAPIAFRPKVPVSRERLCPVLSAADQDDLILQYWMGDRSAADRLLRANHGLIQSVAKRRARMCALLDEHDLVQAGRIGFVESLRDYDSSKGTFRSWAYTFVSRAMSDMMDAEDSSIQIPKRQSDAIRKSLKSGGLSAKLSAIHRLRKTVSVDESVGEDEDDRTMLDMMSARGGSPEDILIAFEEYQATQ